MDYLKSVGMIPVNYITQRHRMKEIGLDSKKWKWKPNDIESVCFELVNNEELISSTSKSAL